MSMRWGLVCLCASFALVACDQPKPSEPVSKPTTEAPKGDVSAPPMGRNKTGESVGRDATAPTKAEVDKLEKAYEAAKADFDKSKDDKAKKEAYLKATMAVGDGYMYSQEIDIKVKYRKALSFYREAYKLDPATPNAKTNIDLIENIYKSMNRPIPE